MEMSRARTGAIRQSSARRRKYRIEGNKWITKVDGAWNVDWVGTERERTFELKGSGLNVTTPWLPNPLEGGRLIRGYLTFEREN
jgi:hypothetical protein